MSSSSLLPSDTVPVASAKSGGRPYHDFVSFVEHHTREGRSLFFDRCHGNNGDDLIIAGAESVFAATGARLAHSPAAADVIVINGGGMFVEGFKQGISKVRQYSEQFPAKPLCIGPQSFHLKSPALREILAARIAPAVVCVRESHSQKNLDQLLAGLPHVEFLEDHDLAFRIPPEHPVFKVPRSEKHILIVERQDGEHHTRARSNKAPAKPAWHRRLAYWILPNSVQSQLRRRRLEAKSERPTPYRRWVEHKIETDFPAFQNLPRFTRDISSRDAATFEQFVAAVASSAVVFTYRLHVGILAARIGKRTFLFEGSYHKCRGIFDRSLSGFPNVTLIPPSAIYADAGGPVTTSTAAERAPLDAA